MNVSQTNMLPAGIAAEVVAAAVEQERQERFIAEQVKAGEAIAGLYPLGDWWRAAYQRWLAGQAPQGTPAAEGSGD